MNKTSALGLAMLIALMAIGRSDARPRITRAPMGAPPPTVMIGNACAACDLAGAIQRCTNTISNIEFTSSNRGELVIACSSGVNKPGAYWPRGSMNNYIYAGGVWFGAQKIVSGFPKGVASISYNPNSGVDAFVPGSISDGPALVKTPAGYRKYSVYLGTNFDPATGESITKGDQPNWPIWIDNDPNHQLMRNRYFGTYEPDTSRRNVATYPHGPAFVSGEDIVSIFKDTDTSANPEKTPNDGLPLGIEVLQRIYTWGYNEYKDMMFVVYDVVNRSGADLSNCYLAPALDPDIGDEAGSHANDLNCFFNPNSAENSATFGDAVTGSCASAYANLNFTYQYSQPQFSPGGMLGLDFLESPAVDGSGYIRPGVHPVAEQLGLKTFHTWTIANDPSAAQRYTFMSDGIQACDLSSPGDKRLLMATGPFNMHAGDTARVVLGIMIAEDSTQPSDRVANLKRMVRSTPGPGGCLIGLDQIAQSAYDSNFVVTGLGRAKVQVVSPATSTAWTSGTSESITWNPTGNTSCAIYYSVDNGTTWTLVINGIPTLAGAFQWLVPTIDESSTRAFLKFTDGIGGPIIGISPQFTIRTGVAVTMSFVSPTVGDLDTSGTFPTTTWVATGATHVALYLSSDSGRTWLLRRDHIATDTPICTWHVPYVAATTMGAILKFTDGIGGAEIARSARFTIMAATAQFTAPTTTDAWAIGTTRDIRWQSSGYTSFYAYLYSGSTTRTSSIVADSISAIAGLYAWRPTLGLTPDSASELFLVNRLDSSIAASSPIFAVDSVTAQVFAPRSTDVWTAGTTETIRWNPVGFPPSIRLALKYVPPVLPKWIIADAVVAANGSFEWNIPDTLKRMFSPHIYFIDPATDSLVAESEAFGFLAATLVDDKPATPSTMQLDQNYPNPFNPSTIIRFALPIRDHARLELFDEKGALVITIAENSWPAGASEIAFDAASLAAGTYEYRLTTSTGHLSRYMTVLK